VPCARSLFAALLARTLQAHQAQLLLPAGIPEVEAVPVCGSTGYSLTILGQRGAAFRRCAPRCGCRAMNG